MRQLCSPMIARAGAAALFMLVLMAGCAPLREDILPPVAPGAGYDSIYPRYVELCAVSQIRATFAKHGGSPGHAVLFLKGVCVDEDAPYPRLKLCDPGTADPAFGTGVSVNKLLKNINWLAVPGRGLFFYGNVDPDEVLDRERALRTIDEAVKTDLFKGVEIHEEYEPPEGDEQALLLLVASETLGTDFALNFGRTTYCSRLPLEEGQLREVVDYLNGLNDGYFKGEVDYNWSGYGDNCVHALRNALAAAGVWAPKPVNLLKTLQLFNLAVPSNEVVNLAFRSNTFGLEDWWQVYSDRTMRESLMERGWLPTRHGALLTIVPVHAKNELWETGRRILVLDIPLFGTKRKRIGRMYEDPRFTDVEANLRWWERRYEGILEKRPPNWDAAPEGNEQLQVRKKYYEYIADQLEDVREKLVLVSRKK